MATFTESIEKAEHSLTHLVARLDLPSVSDLQKRAQQALDAVQGAGEEPGSVYARHSLMSASNLLIVFLGKSKTTQSDRHLAAEALLYIGQAIALNPQESLKHAAIIEAEEV